MMVGLWTFLFFLLGFLLLSFVHTALQVFHGVQQLVRDLHRKHIHQRVILLISITVFMFCL